MARSKTPIISLYLRTEQGQPVRLRDGVAPASRGNQGESGGVDAMEL
jgi:hypothetical protein